MDLSIIKNAGIVGGGGAGFPTWKKCDTKVEYLIVNAAECEPLLRSDQFLMVKFAEKVVFAADAVSKHVGGSHTVIALKKTYTEQISALQAAIRKLKLPVKLHLMEPVYPAGDEQVIVHEVTGRTVPPGGIPGQVGCLVISVSTSCAVADALNENTPCITRYVSVVGEVMRPQIFKVPVGTKLTDLIAAAGGKIRSDCRVIAGGPMMGKLIPADGEAAAVVTKSTGGYTIVPADHKLVRNAELPIRTTLNRAKSVCIQCRRCTDFCPRWLMGHKVRPHLAMRMMAYPGSMPPELFRDSLLCSECGLCENFACPMGLSPRRVNVQLKQILRENKIKPDASVNRTQGLFRSYRQVNVHRLSERLGISKYEIPVPKKAKELFPVYVEIPLSQHIGAPAVPTVAAGDQVTAGQIIAEAPENALSVPMHASISGVVEKVTDRIVIRKKEA